MLGHKKNSLTNKNILAVPGESLDTNFLWNSGSNWHMNGLVPQGKQIWHWACNVHSVVKPTQINWHGAAEKLSDEKAFLKDVIRTLILLTGFSILTKLAHILCFWSIWLSEEYELLQGEESLGFLYGTSALVYVVTLSTNEASKVN